MWEGEKTNKRERTGMDISKKRKTETAKRKKLATLSQTPVKTIKFGKTFKRFTL